MAVEVTTVGVIGANAMGNDIFMMTLIKTAAVLVAISVFYLTGIY